MYSVVSRSAEHKAYEGRCFLLSSLWLSTRTRARHLEGVQSEIIKWVTERHMEQKGWKI